MAAMISFFQSSGKNRITLFYYTYVRVVRTLLAFAADFIINEKILCCCCCVEEEGRKKRNEKKKKKEKKEGKNRLLAK